MCPAAGQVAGIRMNGGNFVSSIRLKGEEETRVTVSLLTHSFNSQQPSTITGGIEAFVEETCGWECTRTNASGGKYNCNKLGNNNAKFALTENNRVAEEGMGSGNDISSVCSLGCCCSRASPRSKEYFARGTLTYYLGLGILGVKCITQVYIAKRYSTVQCVVFVKPCFDLPLMSPNRSSLQCISDLICWSASQFCISSLWNISVS